MMDFQLQPERLGLICVSCQTTRGQMLVARDAMIPIPYLDSPERQLAMCEMCTRTLASTLGWHDPNEYMALVADRDSFREEAIGQKARADQAEASRQVVVNLDDVLRELGVEQVA
jgi:hypothetical protein